MSERERKNIQMLIFRIERACTKKTLQFYHMFMIFFVFQVPSYVIEYEERQFRGDLHVRFHLSRPENDLIQTYLWPALLEGENGPCVQKGVVIT